MDSMNLNPIIPITVKKTAPEADKLEEKKMRAACAEFEALLLSKMLSTMRQSVPKSGLFGDSQAQEMYNYLRDEEMAKELARGKGMGIGEALNRKITGKNQGTPPKRQ